VIPAATLAEALRPLRADPGRSAILLDVDGTLAPIVRHAADAAVPEVTRLRLIELAKRFGLLACVTGRRAADARRMVSIGSIAYIGNHGGEVLLPGATSSTVDPDLAEASLLVRDFARRADTPQLTRARVRIEDKHAIAAFHWRGAPDEPAAEAMVREVAERAEAEGLTTHWGRKVLEVRPRVALDKGVGVRSLLRRTPVHRALYAGDDVTDLDAFRALREMVDGGELESAVLVGVRSDEAPAEITQEADAAVDGPEGVRALLEALLAE
jgi:trehalose 6-phosphate phosphatase